VSRDRELAAAGFVLRRRDGRLLVASPDALDELVELGFDDPATWESSIASGCIPGGRGGSSLLRLGDGTVLRLKRLRRGGALAPLWRDRFAGSGRILANLTLPTAIAARGIATPRAEALLVVSGPPGLHRGWLATRNVAGAEDLAAAARRLGPPDRERWCPVLHFVRSMHDAGLEHRDLNATNLVWTPAGLAVVDLDGARLHSGPLSPALRLRALRRLDRSWVKLFGDRDRADRFALWHELYAGGASPEAASPVAEERSAER
jgi:3-deoxy-D-manno-octulosonic acid kinase